MKFREVEHAHAVNFPVLAVCHVTSWLGDGTDFRKGLGQCKDLECPDVLPVEKLRWVSLYSEVQGVVKVPRDIARHGDHLWSPAV